MKIGRRELLRAAAACGSLALLGVPWLSARAKTGTRPLSLSEPLVIAAHGVARAVVVESPEAGPWERKAADDLVQYIEKMSGAQLRRVAGAPASEPAIFVGRAALLANAGLEAALGRTAKRDPVVQADAILIRREGPHLYVVGTNDESHYFATAWLLQHWGCRWYLPTAFGEHIPHHRTLSVAALDHVYAPPFEIRHYWLSWNGDTTGADEFRHRNFMSAATVPGAGQVLDRYTHDIAPAGQSHFNVPFSASATALHVASRVEADYAAGRDVSLAIADGLYSNDDPGDRVLVFEYDRYFFRPSVTDAMLTLYNNVARILRERHPSSRSRIGGLAYVNATLPPRQVRSVESSIVMWIAPIDIDPNHAMDDPGSPPRLAYRGMVESWAQVVRGRLAIYDYDQSMLVWRDLPNPSHHVFARDVKIYRDIGILGFGTESRGAFATTFLNLFFRGQLMWNPEVDVPTMLATFYRDFYGPAAEPMAAYWSRIFAAWEASSITEHEYFVIPAIYTPALVNALRHDLGQAEAIAQESRGDEKGLPLGERLRFTRLSFEIIDNYVAMVSAAATDVDYARAAEAGERALAARMQLAQINPIFTTRVVGPAAETDQSGAGWLPGEVRQLRELAALSDGSRGTLVAKLPLTWAFRRSAALPADWTYDGPEGPGRVDDSAFAAVEGGQEPGWGEARTDLYLQAQELHVADGQIELGHYWYRTDIVLPRTVPGSIRLLFPGLFNEAWLFVNGVLAAHRPYREPWWLTDYRFEWDVDVSRHLRAGRNVIALRGFNPHHFAGMFRRPFLYQPARGNGS